MGYLLGNWREEGLPVVPHGLQTDVFYFEDHIDVRVQSRGENKAMWIDGYVDFIGSEEIALVNNGKTTLIRIADIDQVRMIKQGWKNTPGDGWMPIQRFNYKMQLAN